jgi:hypothetical protein
MLPGIQLMNNRTWPTISSSVGNIRFSRLGELEVYLELSLHLYNAKIILRCASAFLSNQGP